MVVSTNVTETGFITYYIQSLAERTRHEKTGTKFGIDWVIYNIAIQAGLIPQRLPFIRSGPSETSKTKTEAEFGIDEAFLTGDGKKLVVFVIKDEVLNNTNWISHQFENDLRMARNPDLTASDLKLVEEVEVVLAYNKDEDDTGVRLFDRFVGASGTKIYDSVELSFERWNLSRIVELVRSSLLSPSLLPQKFYSQFSYICSQAENFEHGSDEWDQQLIPAWRSFLHELLAENADLRCVRMLPVALIILRKHTSELESGETAWLDLVEWAMLSAWDVAQTTTNDRVHCAVEEIWIDFYVAELERYYANNSDHLAVKNSLHVAYGGTLVGSMIAGMVAHWHLGRLGLLNLCLTEALPCETEDEKKMLLRFLHQTASAILGLLRANPAAFRPIIDLHHIEFFLVWLSLRRLGVGQDLRNWITILVNCLYMRRIGSAEIPFIEGQNSLELVLETVATDAQPPEFCDQSSMYLSCMLELIAGTGFADIEEFVRRIHQRLVLGWSDDNQAIDGVEPIELMIWFPPTDWRAKIFRESLSSLGSTYSVSYHSSGEEPDISGAKLLSEIKKFMDLTDSNHSTNDDIEIPLSPMILACMKHGTPLLPEFWRSFMYRDETQPTDTSG